MGKSCCAVAYVHVCTSIVVFIATQDGDLTTVTICDVQKHDVIAKPLYTTCMNAGLGIFIYLVHNMR